MRVFCSLLLTVTLASAMSAKPFFEIRDGIPNSQYFLQKNQVGNQYLFFLGDEALEANRLRNKSLRYSTQITQALKRHFPASTPIETRHPFPGGSHFALYRCCWATPVFGERICSGHLAILGFTAGDRQENLGIAMQSLEALLRQIIKYRATHSRILVYMPTPEILAAYRDGRTPEYILRAEALAAHYGVPSLNLAQVAADSILAQKLPEEAFCTDKAAEPDDRGAAVYANAIQTFVDALIAKNPTPDRPSRFKLPPPTVPTLNDNGCIIAYEDPSVSYKGNWQPGQAPVIGPFRHLLNADQAGESLTFTFKGSEVGLLDVAFPRGGGYAFSIDGAPFQTRSFPAVNSPTMRPIYLQQNLDTNKQHILTLRTTGPVKIGGFLLNGNVSDPFAGKSALERIDAIYAKMDPIHATLSKDRFAHIPETMRRLREGGSLRMVLLGDSIMGNTTASQFDLLMGRMYPKCKIQKIASLRSSTGCKWYALENRVESYVLRHKPDLLVIGGISNGQSAEPVRSVIRQVRAKQPNVEILLLTPVFGALRDAHIRLFTTEIDESKPNFRRDLRNVAREEKCAFFDMTAPWWTYVQHSGKTPGWFWGDSVHANARGCQLIGRLLEQWFAHE